MNDREVRRQQILRQTVGLERGTVEVVSYSPDWKTAAAIEKQNLLAEVGDYVSRIEHIGSTAVPGLSAKPIIDLIAAISDLSVYKKLITPLTGLGYEFMSERIFHERIFFPKGSRENRTHHLSLVVNNSQGWIEPITFRDYLRSNASARAKYQARKLELARQYPNDRASYTKAKEQTIAELLKAAKL